MLHCLRERANRLRRQVIALCCLLALAGCASSHPPLPPPEMGPYRLDTGDTLRVIVYNQESLSAEYTIGDSGTISFPLLGEILARSLSVQDLQKKIFDGLNTGILVNPGVSVELTRYRPYFVVGEVGRPGDYAFTPGLNILTAVARAGGFTVRADERRMTVVRKADGR